MHRAALALILVGVTAGPALAQGRGNDNRGKDKQRIGRNSQGIPPGHLPPPGSCRVWYDGVPPGRQPAPTDCYEAERIAARDRYARVVYGDSRRDDAGIYRDDRRYPGDVRRGDDGRYPNDRRYPDGRRYPETDGRRPNPNGNRTGERAVPRDGQYPGTYRYPDSRTSRRGDIASSSDGFRRGYDDGVVKGREDVGDRDAYDPARHGWYRSADRGYNSRYGSREQFRADYRRGFLAGYDSVHDGRDRGSSRPEGD